MTLQEGDAFIAGLYGDDCCCGLSEEFVVTKDDIEEAICDCHSMLDYSIETRNKEEIYFWRRMLQRAKVQRREYLNT